MNQIILSAVIATVISFLIINYHAIRDFADEIIWKLCGKYKSGNNSRNNTDNNRHN